MTLRLPESDADWKLCIMPPEAAFSPGNDQILNCFVYFFSPLLRLFWQRNIGRKPKSSTTVLDTYCLIFRTGMPNRVIFHCLTPKA